MKIYIFLLMIAAILLIASWMCELLKKEKLYLFISRSAYIVLLVSTILISWLCLTFS